MKRTIKFFALAFVFAFVSCSEDDTSELATLESNTASNIPAPQTGGQGLPIGGEFTRFSFATGAVTTSETEWDIAFRGTTVAVNGGSDTGTDEEPIRTGSAGASVLSGTFASIVDADGLIFSEDGESGFAIPTGSDNGWYNYNFITNVVSAIPGVVVAIKTHDGKYAKVEFLSYYKGAPAEPDVSVDESRYYTFNYVYNPNEGETSLE